MALNKTEVRNGRLGQMNMQVVDVAIGTYATNGLAVDPKLFGFTKLLGCTVIGGNAASGGYHAVYDTANNKLVIYWNPAVAAHSHDINFKNAAVADGATTRVNVGANLLGANTGSDLTVAGGGANGGIPSGAAVAAGALTEVTNATNLAAITVRLLGIGY